MTGRPPPGDRGDDHADDCRDRGTPTTPQGEPGADPAMGAVADAGGAADADPWTEAEAEAEEQPDRALALRAAMDRLARRDWARGELVSSLVQAGIDPEEAEDAVRTCVDRGWLDEPVAARRRAERLRRRGPIAPEGIARDLERRQVDPAIAARVAAEAVPDPRAQAEAAIREAIARRGPGDDPADALPWPHRRRLAGRLARRGFDEETILDAMRRCGVPVDEPPEGRSAGGPVDCFD